MIQKNRTAAARTRRICGMALLQLLEQEMRLAAALLGKLLKRLVPACRIDGNRRQELAQLMRRALIEAAEGAACQSCDFLEGALGRGILAFQKHEHGHAEQACFASPLTDLVDALLEGV